MTAYNVKVSSYNIKVTVYKDNVSACIVGVSSYSVYISSYNGDLHIRQLRRSILGNIKNTLHSKTRERIDVKECSGNWILPERIVSFFYFMHNDDRV